MEKRSIFAFLLLIGFFVIWSQFAPKQDTQPVDSQEVSRETINEAAKREKPGIAEPIDKLLPPEGSQLQEVRISNYHIKYSPQGGYIHSVAVGEPAKILPFRDIGFQPANQNKEYRVEIGNNSLTFIKGEVRKKFVFDGDILEIRNVPNSPILAFSFSLNSGTTHISKRYFEVFYQEQDSIQRAHPQKIKEERYPQTKFAGARSRYYAFSLLPGRYDVEWTKNKEKTNLYLNNPPSTVSFYLGPQITDKMDLYDLGGIVYYGFWHFLAIGLIKVLYFFYSFLHNWGLSVIFLSFSTYAVLFPFSSKSTKAMKKMQEIQPLMQELKEKHKDNPQKMQKETVKLYKEHKVNPLGGCLPLLFQFPIIIAFYQVVFRFSRLEGASFLWIKDLSMPDRLFQLPFTIPVVNVEYFNLLPILVMLLGIIQQHLTASSSNPQQKKIGLFMGVFIGIIFYKFPSALVLYWFIQNLLTLLYQVRLKKARTA